MNKTEKYLEEVFAGLKLYEDSANVIMNFAEKANSAINEMEVELYRLDKLNGLDLGTLKRKLTKDKHKDTPTLWTYFWDIEKYFNNK